jgi:hypothetical protein
VFAIGVLYRFVPSALDGSHSNWDGLHSDWDGRPSNLDGDSAITSSLDSEVCQSSE